MKRMTTIVCVIACLFCNTPKSSSQALIDTNSLSIFEIGGQPSSAEENLDKLFANFHLFIENSDEIQLLNYKFISVVDTVEKAATYLLQNFSPGAPAWDIDYTFDQFGRIKNTRLLLHQAPILNKQEVNELVHMIATRCIKAGDRIFQLNFVVNEVEHEYFIFIDKDNRVINEGNLFAFKVSRLT